MRGIILLLLLCLCLPSFAQVNGEHPVINAWIELGTLSFTPTKKDKSSGVDLAFKLQVNRTLINIQYHDYFDSEQSKGIFELFTKDNHYHAGNVLFGLTSRKCGFGHVSVSSGLGVFWGRFENFTGERFATIGWPMEAAASVNIFPFAGINLKVFTNVNPKHSFIGFGMDLQLGKLRDIQWNELIP